MAVSIINVRTPFSVCKRNTRISCLTVLLLLGFDSSAGAASLTLVRSGSGPVLAGDIVTFDVVLDFNDEPTIGGAFDVTYDTTIFELVGVDTQIVGDPEFNRPPDDLPGVLSGWAVGDFDGITAATAGSVTLQVVPGIWSSTLVSARPNVALGVFVSATTFQPQDVDYVGFDVLRDQTVVDTDGDGDPDVTDPDDDNDGIGDALDSEPLIANNNCTGGDGFNATLAEQVVADLTCAAQLSVDVQGATKVLGPDGNLTLIAPSVGIQSGFDVAANLTVISGNPCPGCPTPLPPTTVFVTSNGYAGLGIGGVTSGDSKCQALADAAGLGGTWTAWLSKNGSNAVARLSAAGAVGPFRRSDGVIVAQNLTDLTDSSLAAPISLDQNGVDVAGQRVWTGTTGSGTGTGNNSYCTDDWDDIFGTLAQGTVGEAGAANVDWTFSTQRNCTSTNKLYCFARASGQ